MCLPQGEYFKKLHSGKIPEDLVGIPTSPSVRGKKTEDTWTGKLVGGPLAWHRLIEAAGAPTSILPLEFSPPIFQFPIPLVLSFQCLAKFVENLGKHNSQNTWKQPILKCFVHGCKGGCELCCLA